MNGADHAASTEWPAQESYLLLRNKYALVLGKDSRLTWPYNNISKGLKVLTPGSILFTQHVKRNFRDATAPILSPS